MLNIYCEDFDFSYLTAAFDGEVECDCPLLAEVAIVTEDEIHVLNRKLRGVDSVTDVLSFPSLDNIRGVTLKKDDYPTEIDENGNLFLGSIALCEKRAKEQAEEYGHSFMRELTYLTVHGIFHLLGYDHMTEDDKAQMRECEERVMEKINLKR